MSEKNKLEGRQTPFAFPLSNRSYGSRSSSASFTYFHYTKQNFGIPTNTNKDTFNRATIMDVVQGSVEDEIASIKISKSMEQASGTFTINLLPSRNWKQVISAGDWLIIYFQDDFKAKDRYKATPNNKNMMMLCNVDRISRSLQKGADKDDKTHLRYVIAGRGFGKVFEDTDIWYNPYAVQKDILNRLTLANVGLEMVGSPSKMVSDLVDIFLGNGSTLPNGKVEGLKNFAIPSALAKVFGSNGNLDDVEPENAKFNDILTKRIQENLPGFKVRQMITPNSNGSLHDMMKRSSNDLVNALYYEETRVGDKIELSVFLKPRPTSTIFLSSHLGADPMADEVNGVLKGNSKTLQELSDENYVQISNAEIIYEDMGKDDHSRLNLFWLKPVNGVDQAISFAANFNQGLANPTFLSPSIERHGLKRMDKTLEFCYPSNKSGGKAGAAPDILLWKAFMLQLYDMHYANHLYEAGTIECTGVLECELGKALRILPSNPAIKAEKIYLIEGYEHDWEFPGKWTTKMTLTHGQFKTIDGSDKIFIDVDPDDYGAEDKDIDTIYLAKTESSR